MLKTTFLLLISIVALLSGCASTSTTSGNSIDKIGVWTGYAKNLTYNQTANLKLDIKNYDPASGSASGLALITGSLVGSGKVHGKFTGSSGKFILIPSSGIGAPTYFECKLNGGSMKGTYSIPPQGRIPKQKGKFEVIKDSNTRSGSISNQISQRAKQEVEIWNYGNGITKNTVRITSSHPGVRVEINGDYKGKTPLTLNLAGTRSRSFKKFTKILAYPIHNGGYTQRKYFVSGDKIPSNIYFDMNLVPVRPNKPSVQINLN